MRRRGHLRAGRAGARIAEQVEPEHLGQDPGHHRVHHGPGDRAVLDRLIERLTEVAVERLLGVRAVHRGPGVVDGPVVGHDEPGEAPLVPEHGVLQVGVLAGEVAVDHREGAHHRGRLGLLHRGLERRQVDLVQRPLADQDVIQQGVAVGFLVVDRVVLDLVEYTLALHALDVAGGDGPIEERVLGVGLEGPAPARVAVDVHRGAEVGAGPLAGLLRADHRAVAAG